MASATLTVSDDVKGELKQFSWVNWSEVAKESLIHKAKLQELFEQLNATEEQKLIDWSVGLGRKAKAESFKKMLAELSPEERRELGV